MLHVTLNIYPSSVRPGDLVAALDHRPTLDMQGWHQALMAVAVGADQAPGCELTVIREGQRCVHVLCGCDARLMLWLTALCFGSGVDVCVCVFMNALLIQLVCSFEHSFLSAATGRQSSTPHFFLQQFRFAHCLTLSRDCDFFFEPKPFSRCWQHFQIQEQNPSMA